MSDAWEEIQALKSKRINLREKLEKRKKERQSILSTSLGVEIKSEGSPGSAKNERAASSPASIKSEDLQLTKVPVSLERRLLHSLLDVRLALPSPFTDLLPGLSTLEGDLVSDLLYNLAARKLIVIAEVDGETQVISVDNEKLSLSLNEDSEIVDRKRKADESAGSESGKAIKTDEKDKKDESDILSLLAMPSSREKAVKRVGEEIMELLSKPTAKEKSLADKFKSQGGAQVMEYCQHGTRAECESHKLESGCNKLHFKKIIQAHTDESLGDCSFLNTCFHMDTCKYVHYQVDNADPASKDKGPIDVKGQNGLSLTPIGSKLTLTSPQWVQCDLRYLDMAFLGKFAVIMADPPWDIHMELPYGTMSDDEMRRLGVPQLQDHGLIFLWVTGRAMELGRECLKLWGYERVDELIWVKTNQLQRIIRTGRTGHWLNHGKEHCLVGMKGNPPELNRGLDCDVIVAEVRATSHKPDEIYGIIERLSPGTRKIELFGRPHNVQPNWITLGNQVDGVKLVDPDLIEAFKKRYPDGNCMGPAQTDAVIPSC